MPNQDKQEIYPMQKFDKSCCRPIAHALYMHRPMHTALFLLSEMHSAELSRADMQVGFRPGLREQTIPVACLLALAHLHQRPHCYYTK